MERVVFLVDIDDGKAVRAKKQTSTGVSSDDFCFLFPNEIFEYDPLKIIPVLDDSIAEDSNFRDRLPTLYEPFLSKKSFKKTVSEAFQKGLYMLFYCMGKDSKEKLLTWLQELSREEGKIDIFQNRSFDSEFDNPKNIVIFESYFQQLNNALANATSVYLTLKRAQK